MPEPDDFKKGPISAADLTAMKREAFGDTHVDGGAVHKGAFGTTAYPERPTLRIKVRVFQPTSGGSEAGSDEGGSGPQTEAQALCPDQFVYAFQQVEPIKCGQFQDNTLGYAGDGDFIVAFEQNNQLVKDDTIQTIERHLVWTDDDGEQIEEWIFEAANGTAIPADTTGGSGPGTSGSGPCNGIPVQYCTPGGDQITACLVGNVVLLDDTGNILFNGNP